MTALPRIEAALSALPRDATDEQRARAVVAALAAEWQPAADADPHEDMLTFGENGMVVAYKDLFGRWRQPFKTYFDDVDPEGVTHAMPLPLPPVTP